jgi:uncharacterized protein (DUF58 family)
VRKILYLLFALLTFCLAGRYHVSALMLLFCVEMLMFLMMLAVSVYAIGGLSAEIRMARSEVSKGEFARGWVDVSNSGRLPVLEFRAQLFCSHDEQSEESGEWLRGYAPGKGASRVAFQMESRFCGIINLQLKKMEISDYLSLFKRKKKCHCRAEILVLPTGYGLQTDAWANGGVFAAPERELPASPGTQPPEISKIQPYQPGDSLKDIHWKLSARNDRMLSKQYVEERGWEASVYLDFFTKEGISVRKRDAFLELSSAVSVGLLNGNHPHRICWHDAKRNRAVVHTVDSQEAYQGMIGELVRLLCGSFPETDKTAYAEASYRERRDGEIALTVNMELELLLEGALVFRLSEDDYMRELYSCSIGNSDRNLRSASGNEYY